MLFAVAVFAVDQTAKTVVLRFVEEGERGVLLGPLQWTLFYNDGIAFGVGGSATAYVASLLGLIAFGVLVSAAPPRPLAALGGGLVWGGAVGNFWDRMHHGAVVDFLFFPGTPIFNLADVAITLGVGLLLFAIISPRYSGSHSS